MKHGIRFDEIKVCDNLIIDGHHRYVSSLLADIRIETVPSLKTSATTAHDWTVVEFLDEADKIKYLNELDAKYNGLPIERIIEITKENV